MEMLSRFSFRNWLRHVLKESPERPAGCMSSFPMVESWLWAVLAEQGSSQTAGSRGEAELGDGRSQAWSPSAFFTPSSFRQHCSSAEDTAAGSARSVSTSVSTQTDDQRGKRLLSPQRRDTLERRWGRTAHLSHDARPSLRAECRGR